MGVLKMAGCLERIVCVEVEIPIPTGLVPAVGLISACVACIVRVA
jgi:hypothetical protein